METPIFFSGTKNASSWAMRAWLSLKAAHFEFREEVIDIRRPQRFRGLAKVGRFSPSATVPALVVGDAVIFDSLAIMEFANEVSEGALLPRDLLERARARSLATWQHAGLSAICSRISFESSFYPLKRALTSSEIAECGHLFGALESILSETAGPYLFGAASLADFALAPTAIRLSRHNAPTEAFPLTARWLGSLIRHELVVEWLSEADQLPHIWFDDYLVPDEAPTKAFDLSSPSLR